MLRLKVSRWLDSFQIKFVGRGGEGEFFDLLDPQRELPELGGHCALFQPHRSSFKKMDIYDTSIMDPDPPRPDERPDESSTVRPEDAAPPPPANSEDVSPTLAGLKTVGGAVGGAALAGLGAVKNVAAGLAATVLDDLLEPEENQGALDDVLRRMSGDEDGDGSPPGGLLAHTRNEERRRREAQVSVLARHRRDSQNANRRPSIKRRRKGTRAPPENSRKRKSGGSSRTRSISVHESNFGASLPLESLVDLRTGRRLRFGERPGEPHGCRPARAAARVLRRVHRGRLDHLACFTPFTL